MKTDCSFGPANASRAVSSPLHPPLSVGEQSKVKAAAFGGVSEVTAAPRAFSHPLGGVRVHATHKYGAGAVY